MPATTHDPVLDGLVKLYEKVRADEFARGFALGLKRAAESPAKPEGDCPHCRHAGKRGSLVWAGDPQSCGCRQCKCEQCGGECVSACFPCEYAGA